MSNSQKETLEKKLTEVLSEIKQLIANHQWRLELPDHKKLWDKMVSTASQLHKIVKPTHHKYMIQNRGCDPEDDNFYQHIHPVEDLLAFMSDPKANDDPEDVTIGERFELEIHTRRWGGSESYYITRTESGWFVEHRMMSGDCDKSGKPYLYENFRHDSVNYPESLPGYLRWLWKQAKDKGLKKEDIQKSFNQIGDWITQCETSTPQGVWESY